MPLMPQYCRREAFDYFISQLPSIDTTAGLVHAATAVAMHEMTGVQPHVVDEQLDRFADQILSRVRSRSPTALVAHLHALLFEELGLRGNGDDYYTAGNSYLPRVLETRRGLPVLLTLVYKSVADRIGLNAFGINSPGHFLAAVQIEAIHNVQRHGVQRDAVEKQGVQWDGPLMLVDPFDGGRVLTRAEVSQRVLQVTGQALLPLEEPLPIATHGQWIARIIVNLVGVFTRAGDTNNLFAMRELLAAIK